MGFNNGYEKKIFLDEWEKKRKLMIEAGMNEIDIEKMFAFDWEWFKNIRRFEEKRVHNYDIDENEVKLGTEDTGLDLVEQLEDIRLIKGLYSLNEKELDLLIKIVIQEYKQVEIAREQGISKSTVSLKFDALKAKIRRNVEND